MKPSGENFIPGIYNYCDRWCERCLYTDRCRVFVMEKEFTETYEAEQRHKKSREENRKFWEQIDKALEEASETYDDLIPEKEKKPLSEMDFLFDDDDIDSNDDEYEKYHENARQHTLSQTAERYEIAVTKWFDERKETIPLEYNPETKTLTVHYAGMDNQRDIQQLSEAAEVIRWYELQIHVKIIRALTSRQEEDAKAEFYKDLPKDSEGSASVALKGIEKSLGAWNIFYQYMEEERTTIAPLITLLFLLRAGLLKTFPGAATFRWPPEDQEPG